MRGRVGIYGFEDLGMELFGLGFGCYSSWVFQEVYKDFCGCHLLRNQRETMVFWNCNQEPDFNLLETNKDRQNTYI